MIGPIAAALALCELAAPRPAAERPIAVLVAPDARAVLPRIRGLAELSPRALHALEREARILGFDPLDPAALAANGIDVAAPIYIWLPAERAPLVAELAVAKPELADAAIARVLASAKRGGARALERSPEGAGFFTGPAEDPELVVQRRGLRLFVQRAHGRSLPSTAADGLPAIASAQLGSKPKEAPEAGAEKGAPAPHLWLVARGDEGVERVHAAIRIEPRRLEVRARAWLDMTTGLIVGDLAGRGGPARRLLDAAVPELAAIDTAAELTVRVGSAGLAETLDVASLGADKARALSGEIHAVLTAGGSLVAALGVARDVAEEKLEAITAALGTRAEGGAVRVVNHHGERTILVTFAAQDAAQVQGAIEPPQPAATQPAATQPATTQPGARAAPLRQLELRFAPPLLFDALGKRARSKDSLRLSRTRVGAAELELGELAAKVHRAELTVAPRPGTVDASLLLEW